MWQTVPRYQQWIDVASKARRAAYPTLLAPKCISLVQYVGGLKTHNYFLLALDVTDFTAFSVLCLILNIFALKYVIHIFSKLFYKCRALKLVNDTSCSSSTTFWP
jgi:hypothetical protein